MIKPSNLNTVFLIIPAVILIPCIVCSLLVVLEISQTIITKAITQSTDSLVFTAKTLAQKAIPASKESITIGDFKFRISTVAFNKTAMGFIPVNMNEGDQVMFVEFELLEGSKESFIELEITVSCGSGQKSNAFILISGGMMKMLATVIMKRASSDYKPGKNNIAWAYVVPKSVDKLYLNFPSGEIVDLAPFIK